MRATVTIPRPEPSRSQAPPALLYHRLMPASSPTRCLMCCLLLLLASAATRGQGQTRQEFELSGDRWEKVRAVDPESPEGQLQEVRRLLARGHDGRAAKAATAWLKHYRAHPLRVEARLLRGDARAAGGDYWNALRDYEFIASYFPASEQFNTVLQREFEIGKMYVEGLNRKLLGLRLLPADGEGRELLIRIQERAPGSEIGERASLLLADSYFEHRDYPNAADAYDLFVQNYPRSDRREYAMLQLVRASLRRFKGPRYDAAGLLDARQRLATYQSQYPAAAEEAGAPGLMQKIENSLAVRDLLNARWYEKRNDDVAATFLYRRLLEEFPTTPAAERAAGRLRKLGVRVGEAAGGVATQ